MAIFFANYTNEAVSFPYSINPADYGLEGTWKVKEIGIKRSKNIDEFSGKLNRTEELGPGKLKVVELIPED